MKESPIFARTYDLLRWLIPHTLQFPRQQRFVLAEAVQQAALQFHEELVEAAYAAEPAPVLQHADVTLTRLRFYLRLCRDLKLLSTGQHEHAARMVSEVGSLLGGWRKTQPSTDLAAGGRPDGRPR
jgi:hypothetical protein